MELFIRHIINLKLKVFYRLLMPPKDFFFLLFHLKIFLRRAYNFVWHFVFISLNFNLDLSITHFEKIRIWYRNLQKFAFFIQENVFFFFSFLLALFEHFKSFIYLGFLMTAHFFNILFDLGRTFIFVNRFKPI